MGEMDRILLEEIEYAAIHSDEMDKTYMLELIDANEAVICLEDMCQFYVGNVVRPQKQFIEYVRSLKIETPLDHSKYIEAFLIDVSGE